MTATSVANDVHGRATVAYDRREGSLPYPRPAMNRLDRQGRLGRTDGWKDGHKEGNVTCIHQLFEGPR